MVLVHVCHTPCRMLAPLLLCRRNKHMRRAQQHIATTHSTERSTVVPQMPNRVAQHSGAANARQHRVALRFTGLQVLQRSPRCGRGCLPHRYTYGASVPTNTQTLHPVFSGGWPSGGQHTRRDATRRDAWCHAYAYMHVAGSTVDGALGTYHVPSTGVDIVFFVACGRVCPSVPTHVRCDAYDVVAARAHTATVRMWNETCGRCHADTCRSVALGSGTCSTHVSEACAPR